MAKHTPGPWRLDISDFGETRIETADDEFFAQEIAEDLCGFEDEKAANAKRIVDCVNACEGLADPSVVPELLEALEFIKVLAAPGTVMREKADAAIARAKGGAS